MGLFSFLFGGNNEPEYSDPWKKFNHATRTKLTISEGDARNFIRNLYSTARNDFAEFVNIRNVSDYYKKRILDIISDARLSELVYVPHLSNNYEAVFKFKDEIDSYYSSYSCRVSAFEYTGEHFGHFFECNIFKGIILPPLLIVVWGYDTERFYRNCEQNYTLSPLKGLTE